MDDVSVHPKAPRIPFAGRFYCTRGELIADGIVHAVGIVLAISAGSVLLSLSAFHTGPWEYVGAIFYVFSLLTAFSLSAAYNMWPISPAKWTLRRFDHAAIYLLIAGTYTPFLAQMENSLMARVAVGLIWGAALIGMAVKLFLPGRFDRAAVVFYLALGWSGVVVFRALSTTLPPATIWLIAAGGVVYTVGVIFYAWRGLRYQTALWHGFVLLGAVLHLSAVMDSLVISRL